MGNPEQKKARMFWLIFIIIALIAGFYFGYSDGKKGAVEKTEPVLEDTVTRE